MPCAVRRGAPRAYWLVPPGMPRPALGRRRGRGRVRVRRTHGAVIGARRDSLPLNQPHLVYPLAGIAADAPGREHRDRPANSGADCFHRRAAVRRHQSARPAPGPRFAAVDRLLPLVPQAAGARAAVRPAGPAPRRPAGRPLAERARSRPSWAACRAAPSAAASRSGRSTSTSPSARPRCWRPPASRSTCCPRRCPPRYRANAFIALHADGDPAGEAPRLQSRSAGLQLAARMSTIAWSTR